MMKQMVYVVKENEEITGVWDEFEDAQKNVSPIGTITPVVVNHYREQRYDCMDAEEVVLAMENELKSLTTPVSPIGDEDEDWDDEDDEDDNEEEDMDSIIYDINGHPGICEEDARLLLTCVTKVMKEKYPHLPDSLMTRVIQNAFLEITERYGIEVVDCSEGEDE